MTITRSFITRALSHPLKISAGVRQDIAHLKHPGTYHQACRPEVRDLGIGALQILWGAAVTKFPTKYFRMELCVESGTGNGEGVSPP